MTKEALFNIKEAARRQGCSVRLMSKLLTEKRITCIRVGGLIRFKQSFLDAYNESRTIAAVSRDSKNKKTNMNAKATAWLASEDIGDLTEDQIAIRKLIEENIDD